MDKRITVVLADANEEFRTALKQALEATGEFDVVGCAADGLAAAQDIAERKPQLLVMARRARTSRRRLSARSRQ